MKETIDMFASCLSAGALLLGFFTYIIISSREDSSISYESDMVIPKLLLVVGVVFAIVAFIL